MTPKSAYRRQRRQVNLKLLLGTILFIVLVVPCVVFLHDFQMSRVVSVFEEKIVEAEQSENWAEAARYGERYLLLRPTDGKAKVSVAKNFDKTAVTNAQIQRAVSLHSVALGTCESTPSLAEHIPELRKMLAERLLQLGRYEDCMETLGKLAQPEPDNFIQSRLALCKYRLAVEKRTQTMSSASKAQLPPWLIALDGMNVVDLLAKCLADVPSDIILARIFADLLTDVSPLLEGSQFSAMGTDELNSRAMLAADRMLDADRKDVERWLGHYAIVAKIDRESADRDVTELLKIAPEDPLVQHQAGLHYLRQSKELGRNSEKEERQRLLQLAEKYLGSAKSSLKSKDSNFYLALGEVLYDQNKSQEAMETWKEGLRIVPPPTINLHTRIINEHLKSKNLELAKMALEEMDGFLQKESPLIPKAMQNSIVRVAKQQWSSFYMAKGDYQQATSLVEQVVANNRDLDLVNQAESWAFLGGAYFQMKQFDRSANAFEQAASLAPQSPVYQRGAAQAWFGAQRYQEVVKRLQNIDAKSGADWLLLAEAIIQIQKLEKQSPELWQDFDASIAGALQFRDSDSFLISRPWTIDLLRLEAKVLRSDSESRSAAIEEAASKILELADSHPESAEFGSAAAILLGDWGLSGTAANRFSKSVAETTVKSDAQWLEEIEDKSDAVEVAKVIGSAMQSTPGNEFLLREATRRVGPADKLDLLLALYQNSAPETKQSFAFVRSLSQELLNSQPTQTSRKSEVDPILVEKWRNLVTQFEDYLKALEGESGTEWRYVRAKRLLSSYPFDEGEKEARLREATELAGYLDRQRPQWVNTKLLQAQVEELTGNYQQAIREYKRAIQLGAQDLAVYERLIGLMYKQGMVSEASALIEKLGARTNQSSRLSSIALGLSSQSSSSMLELAEDGTRARPNDPFAWIWLAQVLQTSSNGLPAEEMVKQLEKADRAVEKALTLADASDSRIPAASFSYYRTRGNTEQALKIQESLSKNEKLDKSVRLPMEAEMLEALGENEKALHLYETAFTELSDNKLVGLRWARLLSRLGNQAEAIAVAEKLHIKFGNDDEVHRLYAALLGNRGTEADWKKLSQLLNSTEKRTGTADDKRLEVELLLQKGEAQDLARAQTILERLVEDVVSRTVSDRFRLASVYLRSARAIKLEDGETSDKAQRLIGAAGQQLRQIATGQNVPIQYIYAYADFLLENGNLADATRQLDRLKEASPESLTTAVLNARIENASGNNSQAIQVVDKWLDANKKQSRDQLNDLQYASFLTQVSEAYQILREPVKAELLMREAFALDPRYGRMYARSVSEISDSKVKEEVLRNLVARASKEQTRDNAILLSSVLSGGGFSGETLQQAESLLKGIQSSSGSDEDLQLAMADYWLSRNQQDQAVESYRQIIKSRPNDVIALNNLANLLAEKPESGQEALEYIDRALRIAGRQPLLLDTRGVILLNSNRLPEAIQTFQVATAASPDVRLAFHLYIALKRAGRMEDAERVKRVLKIDELKRSLLTPGDELELQLLLDERK